MKAHAYVLGLTHDPDEDLTKNKNVHVHCPAGAVPKVASLAIVDAQLIDSRLALGHYQLTFNFTPGWPKRRGRIYDRHDIHVFWSTSFPHARHDW